MPTRNRFTCPAPAPRVAHASILFALALAAWWVAAAGAQGPGKTVETVVTADGVEEGLGAEQRPAVDRAHKLLLQKKPAEAEPILDEVLAFFEKQMKDPQTTYHCFANEAELKHYRKEHPKKGKVVWLDWAFGTALHARAFTLVARKQWDKALAALEREASYRPYAAAPHTERGYVLNQRGKFKEALRAYRRALTLAERHATSRNMRGVALRGIGFALVELKDLPGARNAFERSLVIDPDNPLALAELRFIEKLEKQQK